MVFSIEDFGEEPSGAVNHPCPGCPRCKSCHQQFRFMCEATTHCHEKPKHTVVFNDKVNHSCGCPHCLWIVATIAITEDKLVRTGSPVYSSHRGFNILKLSNN